jgi:UDP-N-acetylmuramoyl-tripeptide--D-alanyl-D-alanine ligase
MIPQSFTTLTEWTGGRLLAGDPHAVVGSVCTDTRNILPGCLFVALAGERFDAHDFTAQAIASGAVAVMVSRAVVVPAGAGVVLVDDTLAGLQALAAAYRRVWGGQVIGLTGSNGKTSTKDMIRAVLARRFKVCATRGNLNNHIGLPLTVLSAEAGETHGVFEMGMNHPGEIAPLAAIAGPDVAVITNIGTAHIEYMGSREAIALEKGMLAEAVHPDGVVILNANDPCTPELGARCQAQVFTAGTDAGAIRVTDVHSSGTGCTFFLHLPDHSCAQVQLSVPGRHMAGNAALAAAVGFHYGLRLEEIVEGLESAVLTHGRLQLRAADGLLFLDDSYNANPDSMRAALETLLGLGCRGRRLAVLGRMGELGDTAAAEHRALGAAVHQAGVDELCVVGLGDAELITAGFLEAGGNPAKHHAFAGHLACAAHLRATAGATDIILVKGSRSAAMERVIEPPAA